MIEFRCSDRALKSRIKCSRGGQPNNEPWANVSGEPKIMTAIVDLLKRKVPVHTVSGRSMGTPLIVTTVV